MFVGVALQSAAQNFGMFVGSRFLIGFGVSLAHGAAPLLVTELAHFQHRARITTLYNTTWYIGSVIAAWVTFGTFRISNTWSWRIPSILQAAPACIMLSCIFFVPESPRWLISRGRNEEALQILARYHANGNINDELVKFEYAEIREALDAEAELVKQNFFQGLKELFATKPNRHRMAICIAAGVFSQLSGNALVSYYINDILNQVGITDDEMKTIINGVLNIWNMIVATSMAFAVDKAGRRPLFLTSTAGMLLMFICWTIASKFAVEDFSKAAGSAVVAFIFLYYTFYNMAWSGLLVSYCVEIRKLPRCFEKSRDIIVDGVSQCHSASVPVVWPSCSSASTPPCSSTATSTPLPSKISAGSTISCTTPGLLLSSSSCTSSSWRPGTLLSRRSTRMFSNIY